MPKPVSEKIKNSIATGWKTCVKCKEHLPHEKFSKHKAMKDGRRPDCKKCKYVQELINKEYKHAQKVRLQAKEQIHI